MASNLKHVCCTTRKMVGLLARPVQMGFVDVGNAFDRVPQGFLGRYSRGIGNQPPWLGLPVDPVSELRLHGQEEVGLCHGCHISPILFIIFVDRISGFPRCSLGPQRFPLRIVEDKLLRRRLSSSCFIFTAEGRIGQSSGLSIQPRYPGCYNVWNWQMKHFIRNEFLNDRKGKWTSVRNTTHACAGMTFDAPSSFLVGLMAPASLLYCLLDFRFSHAFFGFASVNLVSYSRG